MQADPTRVKPSVEQPMGPDMAPAADRPLAEACDAGRVQDLVGKALTAATQADAKVRSGAAGVRAYKQGDMLTMDVREDRLNIETDASGRITKLSCG